MGFSDVGFRTRAASLLHPIRSHNSNPDSHPTSPTTAALLQYAHALDDPRPLDAPNREGEKSLLLTLTGETANPSVGVLTDQEKEARGIARTIPSWIKSREDDDGNEDTSSQLLLHAPPPDAQIAQHNNSPAQKVKTKQELARRHDAQRDWEPPLPRYHVGEYGFRWRAFVDASAVPRIFPYGEVRVDEEWLTENGPDYSKPWRSQNEENGERRRGRREAIMDRIQHTILRNPMVPLVIRTIVWVFSLAALVLGAIIYRGKQSTSDGFITSPEMAIIVDAVAMVYLIYITYDEYTGKPLGLRSAKAKMRLIFLDMFFIVFDSANLSLAFQSVSDVEVSCKNNDRDCRQQRALASVLLIALIAWMMTFAISVLRVIERVTQE